MIEAKAEFFFEVSWEVCNKVGGIYTVVKSKILPMKKFYGDKYFAIGPYFMDKAAGQFQELLPPTQLKNIFEKLKSEGIYCHFGTWLVPGDPKTILIDYSEFSKNTNDIKKKLWEEYKIDSLNTEYHDFDEPVVWSFAVGRLLEEIAALGDGSLVAQFHEWLSGGALLHLKMQNSKIAKVFTTHATILGRTLSGRNGDLYSEINDMDPKKKAYELGIGSKHQMESACAQNADVFTTVSEITAIEAEALLDRKPEVLLPNGLDMEKFPTLEKATLRHRIFREKIRQFIMYYFFPYYKFDLEKTLIFFIAGRYEFHDKGIDIFIKALANLNERLKKENSNKTIVSFFWIPAGFRGIRHEILENKTIFKDIKDYTDDSKKEIIERLLYGLISQKSLTPRFLLGEETVQEINKGIIRLNKYTGKTPPLSTHYLNNEDQDAIMQSFKKFGLTNKKEDKVKVVFYPLYLNGADRLLDLTYYESMTGSHLGVFPSYYEPWGYTPLEAGALGVASVTTDCAGFGRYLLEKAAVTRYPGIHVLKRLNESDDKVTDELTNILYDYSTITKHERIEHKIRAKRLASLADWKILVENYIKAHNLALEKWN